MRYNSTAIKLGFFSVVLLLCTALLIVVFGQLRFERYNTYSAEFSNGSGLRPGQFVRAGGVEVGKVSRVALTDSGQRALVTFKVDKSLPLYQSTTAQLRYANLIGDRFLNLERGTGEGADRVLPAGGFIFTRSSADPNGFSGIVPGRMNQRRLNTCSGTSTVPTASSAGRSRFAALRTPSAIRRTTNAW